VGLVARMGRREIKYKFRDRISDRNTPFWRVDIDVKILNYIITAGFCDCDNFQFP
jgi:hypothetical protein